MLAAAPKSPTRANLFRLVLTLSSHQQPAPESLVEHFDILLAQAKALSLTPLGVRGDDLLPEAIDLAFEIKLNGSFHDDIMAIPNYHALTPHVAEALLKQLESSPVY